MRVRLALLALVLPAMLTACSSVDVPSGGSSVVIANASTVTLTDVHVSTGPDDDVASGTIAAGATTEARAVHAVYGNVHVTARVGNQSVSVIPIEGFVDGFNTRLPDGAYTIVLTIHVETDGTYWMEAIVRS